MQEQDSVNRLIFELAKLPGIGEKTATRLTYFILKQDSSYAGALASALQEAKSKTALCEKCFTFTDARVCPICSSKNRDDSILCVVEKPSDVHSIERTVSFKGRYHVLHGVLSPLDGVGPDELKFRELMTRLGTSEGNEVREVLIATNPTVEGDATALYLSKLLKPSGIRVSKLAHGLPAGGQLEFTDQQTIMRAIENRMAF